MDYEITSPGRGPLGLPGYARSNILTLTSFVTSRSLIRTGILISCGNGKLTRFNQLYRAKLLPVGTDYYRTDSLFMAPFGLSSLWCVVVCLPGLSSRSRRLNLISQIVSDRRIGVIH